jgi:hypothetical protein
MTLSSSSWKLIWTILAAGLAYGSKFTSGDATAFLIAAAGMILTSVWVRRPGDSPIGGTTNSITQDRHPQ